MTPPNVHSPHNLSEKCFIVALPWNREVRDASPQQQFQAYAQKIAQAGGPTPTLFDVPVTLKVGTLDSVMECSDDLFKIDGQVRKKQDRK